ncbi:hypothetical protein [Bacillus sp. S3]|nr:hypothetical protein [Bacillus sp. S3]
MKARYIDRKEEKRGSAVNESPLHDQKEEKRGFTVNESPLH